MLIERSKIEEKINKRLEFYCTDKTSVKTMADTMINNHGVSPTETMEIITLRRSISEYGIFILYCIAEALSKVDSKIKVESWFTENEINQYKDQRIHIETMEFPIVIGCLRVTDGQFIAVTDLQFFMSLRRAQMIAYNPKTQRTMTRVIRGREEFYKISVNYNAVEQIKEEMERDEYIPNTITLRIPEDSDWFFNEKKNQLVIQEMKAFDIADGFHRFIAMGKIHDENPEFNIKMELRIITYSETKTRQFIWQEDQKTRMRKVDSDSLNTNAGSNIVCDGLNEDPMFNLKGCINRNGGQIPYADFSVLIDRFFFKGTKKENQRLVVIETRKKIREFFNQLTEMDTGYLSRKYDITDLLVIMCIIEDGDYTEANLIIDKAKQKIEEDVNLSSKIRRRLLTERTISLVKNVIKGVR